MHKFDFVLIKFVNHWILGTSNRLRIQQIADCIHYVKALLPLYSYDQHPGSPEALPSPSRLTSAKAPTILLNQLLPIIL